MKGPVMGWQKYRDDMAKAAATLRQLADEQVDPELTARYRGKADGIDYAVNSLAAAMCWAMLDGGDDE